MSSFAQRIPDIPKKEGWALWKDGLWFLRYALATSRWQAALLIGSLILMPIQTAGFLFVTKWLIDALSAGSFQRAQGAFIALIGIFLMKGLVELARQYVQDTLRLSLDLRLKQDLTNHLQRIDPAMIEHPKFQSLYHAYQEERGNVLSLLQGGIWMLFGVLELLGYISVFFLLPWWAFLLILLPMALVVRMVQGEKKWSWQVLDMQSREGRRGNYYKSVLLDPDWISHRWIMGLHRLFYPRWLQVMQKGLALRFQQSLARAKTQAVSLVIVIFGMCIGAIVLFLEARSGAGFGALVVFFPAYQSFAQKFAALVGEIAWVQGSLPAASLTRTVFDLPVKKEGKKALSAKPLTIEFNHVTFAYPDQKTPVLQDISLRLREGEYVALVGLNGAGKSTFLKLLAGIYKPTSGQILVNGVSLGDIRSEEWVKHLGYMTQDVPRFDDTVKEQIRYGNPKLAWGKLGKDVLRVSGFDEVVKELPKGLDTHIGRTFGMPEDQPVELSGGQRQLLMIAQTLYRRARVYIFDEPTSAVDAEKEEAFFQALPPAIEGSLALVVSHRFSVLRRAERVLVMEAGRIIEDGSHDELMQRAGRYAELFALQAKMYNESL